MTGKDLSSLARFLGIEPGPDPGSLDLPVTDRVKNSYGAPIGGAAGILASELVMADASSNEVDSLHVGYLGRAKEGLLARRDTSWAVSPSGIVDVLIGDTDNRLVAHVTATTRQLPALEKPVTDGPLTDPEPPASSEPWRHVPLLAALEIAELPSADGEPYAFEMPLTHAALTTSGRVHAGALFTLADLAGGQSALRVTTNRSRAFVTLVASLHLLGTPLHGPVRAFSRNLHEGRTATTAAVRIVDATATIVATATVTMLRVSK